MSQTLSGARIACPTCGERTIPVRLVVLDGESPCYSTGYGGSPSVVLYGEAADYECPCRDEAQDVAAYDAAVEQRIMEVDTSEAEAVQ